MYFSVPDNVSNSYVEINGQQLENTQYTAYVIQENTGANIFRILHETPCPTDHSALLKVAQEEKQSGAPPKIKDVIKNFEQYDAVFIGYPNRNADLPNILYTFFDSYDFSGKTGAVTMNRKMMEKVCVDAAMFVLFLLLMSDKYCLPF